MNKMKKRMAILTTIFVIGAAGALSIGLNARRRRGGRGRGRGRIGFGVSVGVGRGRRPYRRGYWRRRHYRPWYRRPYWGLGYYLGYPSTEKYSWEDSMDRMHWRMRNDSDFVVTVRSDDGTITLEPGESKTLPRNKSFVFTARTDDGQRKTFETSNHVVTFHGRRRLKMRSYIE